MSSFFPRTLLLSLLLSFSHLAPGLAQDGFAEKATGGAGGRQVLARTAGELRTFAAAEEPLQILVQGTLVAGNISVKSNKTITGTGSQPTIVGNLILSGWVSNIIIRNLNITNPMSSKGKGGGDGITLNPARTVWIDHCTFYDCGDGCLDMSDGSDWVTVSWCKFYYTKQPEHRFTMLALGRENSKKKKTKNKLHLTLHHNWWAENCDQRMPAAMKARVHLYNNYFSCSGNSYCTNGRRDAELLGENNFYDGVQNPCYVEDGGKWKTSGHIYRNCTGKMGNGRDDVFKPPYKYSVERTEKVPELVRAGGGAR